MGDWMITAKARAKINLTLDILGKRPDGYHEVSMVMQQLELSDTLRFHERPKGSGIQLLSDLPGFLPPEKNLAYKAARLIMETHKVSQGVRIELAKRIPIAAGLAGGSADAAAALNALNGLFCLGLGMEELCALGAQIGSDVPFCLRGGTMLATGRGEVLKRLPPMPVCHVVLAKPRARVSTAWAYQNYRAAAVKKRPETERVIGCLTAGDLAGVGALLCNVLESVTIKAHADIAALKDLMIQNGALASLMSGSGPTVFGLTPDEERALYIAEKLRALTEAQVFVTKTVSKIEG